jgi:protein-S-isoprenylcysteine O-methyltransferase Ste14
MTEQGLYPIAVAIFIALAPLVLLVLLIRPAPYGRHAPARSGPTLPARIGWLLFELPSVLVFGACFLAAWPPGFPSLCLLFLWELHYVYRALIYPFLLRRPRPLPLLIVALGCAFTGVNGYLNGRAVTVFAVRPDGWLADPRFLIGAALFLLGLAIHIHADRTLRRLRGPGEAGYRIPHGGLFRFVTSPNYLGEIIQWSGWALASFSPAGLAFALWTVANLLPRALAHHRWYRATFPDYPPERRALIPGLL